jgi:hypothetical protein
VTCSQFFLAELFGGIVLIIVVAALYEGLKTLREILALLSEAKNSKVEAPVNAGTEREPLVAYAGRGSR